LACGGRAGTPAAELDDVSSSPRPPWSASPLADLLGACLHLACGAPRAAPDGFEPPPFEDEEDDEPTRPSVRGARGTAGPASPPAARATSP
jgi:hypothetical protein